MNAVDYRLERIRAFAASRLLDKSDVENLCARLQKHNYGSICQWQQHVRIGETIYRLEDEDAAETLAFLLADYVRDHGLNVRVLQD